MAADSGMPSSLSLPAVEMRERLASGALLAVDLAEAVNARIATREEEVQAWAWFDPDYLRQQAEMLDTYRRAGHPIGPLHGMPVGLKDIIDTARIPTENGCAQDEGRVPDRDATLVSRLRAAGAMIVGKTVTTELAFMQAGKTRNPHDTTRTPGGSSSGSAAAVADGMVPLAVGTQTGGSVIRPAAFCGATGFKPTFGLIPRTGVLTQSPSLDTIGVFAADPTGAAMIADVMAGYDAGDPATEPMPSPQLVAIATEKAPVKPQFAFVELPGWSDAAPETRSAFEELNTLLGDQVFGVDLSGVFAEAADLRSRINFAEMAHHYERYEIETLGPKTRAAIEEGRGVMAKDYLDARAWKNRFAAALDEIFTRSDVILCPAALGPAPKGLDDTGDSIFNGIWTMTGVPSVTIPVFTSEEGLPMGVQLVGQKHRDGRLLRTANWLLSFLESLER